MFWASRSVVEHADRAGAATMNRRVLFRTALAAVGAIAVARPGLSSGLYRDRPALPGLGPSFRTRVPFPNSYKPGTIVVEPGHHWLYFTIDGTTADRYKISVGRQGFGWSGQVTVGAKREWPSWRPPASMRTRSPDLPEVVPPGPYNPLGARALYLFKDGHDTLYRIHGTNDPGGVGSDGTSGCFRLTNTDIMNLYQRVSVGTMVIVR